MRWTLSDQSSSMERMSKKKKVTRMVVAAEKETAAQKLSRGQAKKGKTTTSPSSESLQRPGKRRAALTFQNGCKESERECKRGGVRECKKIGESGQGLQTLGKGGVTLVGGGA